MTPADLLHSTWRRRADGVVAAVTQVNDGIRLIDADWDPVASQLAGSDRKATAPRRFRVADEDELRRDWYQVVKGWVPAPATMMHWQDLVHEATGGDPAKVRDAVYGKRAVPDDRCARPGCGLLLRQHHTGLERDGHEFVVVHSTEPAPMPMPSSDTAAELLLRVTRKVSPDPEILRVAIEGYGPRNYEALLAPATDSPAQHPPPWRWDHPGYPKREDVPHALALFDANDNEVIGADGDDYAWVTVASPYVRAVVELAPVMEARLRAFLEMAFSETGKTVERCRWCAIIGGPFQARHYDRCPVGPAATALAKLDAARKAG